MEIVKKIDNEEKYPVIASEKYLQSIKGCQDYGYFIENNLVLPFVIRARKMFKWIQLDCPVLGETSIEEEKKFLDNIVEYAKKNMAITHIVSTNTAIFNTYPSSSYYCKFGSYIVDLCQTEEVLFKNLNSKHRNVIRKAQSDGIIIEHGSEKAADAIALMQETFCRQNKVSGIDNSMEKQLRPMGDNVDYWIARDPEGNLQGSAIFFWSKGHSCYYMHGGSAAHTKPGAMNLLMWEAMKCMKGRGVKFFDFVGARLTTESGSKLEGIQRFKSRFGAEMKVGYMFRAIVNKPYYFLYRFAINTVFLFLTHKIPTDAIEEERNKGNM